LFIESEKFEGFKALVKKCLEGNKKTHPLPNGREGGPNYEKQTKQAMQI